MVQTHPLLSVFLLECALLPSSTPSVDSAPFRPRARCCKHMALTGMEDLHSSASVLSAPRKTLLPHLLFPKCAHVPQAQAQPLPAPVPGARIPDSTWKVSAWTPRPLFMSQSPWSPSGTRPLHPHHPNTPPTPARPTLRPGWQQTVPAGPLCPAARGHLSQMLWLIAPLGGACGCVFWSILTSDALPVTLTCPVKHPSPRASCKLLVHLHPALEQPNPV